MKPFTSRGPCILPYCNMYTDYSLNYVKKAKLINKVTKQRRKNEENRQWRGKQQEERQWVGVTREGFSVDQLVPPDRECAC